MYPSPRRRTTRGRAEIVSRILHPAQRRDPRPVSTSPLFGPTLTPMSRSRATIDVSSYLIEPDPSAASTTIDWMAMFGNGRPVELEIGSGKGLFLANAATANPGHNFLGIELARKYARLAAQRLAKLGSPNAKVWAADAREVLTHRIPDASLLAPFTSTSPTLGGRNVTRSDASSRTPCVTQIERAIEKGGELHVASDVEEYFTMIRELIGACPRFRGRPVPELGDPEHDLDYLTNFERKYRLEGRPIYRASYDLP